MPALITFLSICLFILFIGMLRATITIEYNGEVTMSLRLLFIKIRLVPKREKRRPHSMSKRKAKRISNKLEAKKAKKREKRAAKKKEKDQRKADLRSGKVKKEKKSPQEILDVITLVCNLITKVIGKFFGHLRIKVARIRMVIGTEDAATTAITYGAVTQAINVIFPLLEDVKRLSLPSAGDIDIIPDFTSDETEIDIKVSFALRVWHILHVIILALVQLVKYFFNVQKHKDENEAKKSTK